MKKLIITIITCVFFFNYIYAFNSITLSDYSKYIHYIKSNLSDFSILRKYNILWNKKVRCNFFEYKDYYYVNPGCILYWYMPELSLKESVDLVFPFIIWFKNVYNLDATGFFYKDASPIFSIKYDIDSILWNTIYDKVILKIMILSDTRIKIPKMYLAFKQIKNYSFYVAWKDLSKRNWWRLVNFSVALKKLNNYILNPWSVLFVNKELANLNWYYKETKDKKYMFYWWVCWVSTMFFRVALINPYLYILKRYNHGYRYVNFYSNYLYWDDAAIYEFNKILKIKNISDKKMIFKSKRIWNEIYLVNIVPKKVDYITYVEKYKISYLTAKVSKTIFDKYWHIIRKLEWISKYIGYNYEK